MIRYNLNYNDSTEIATSIIYLDSVIDKYATNKNVILLGTSQGATMIFHYIHSNYFNKLRRNISGAWLHDMAGFYPEFLSKNVAYKYFTYFDGPFNSEYDMHSFFNDYSTSLLNRNIRTIINSRMQNNIFFYNTRCDWVVPYAFKKKMLQELFRIYNCSV